MAGRGGHGGRVWWWRAREIAQGGRAWPSEVVGVSGRGRKRPKRPRRRVQTGGWGSSKKRKPKVIIGPNSTVVGDIILEREVELFISNSAKVGGVSGEMSINDAVRFSGDRP